MIKHDLIEYDPKTWKAWSGMTVKQFEKMNDRTQQALLGRYVNFYKEKEKGKIVIDKYGTTQLVLEDKEPGIDIS